MVLIVAWVPVTIQLSRCIAVLPDWNGKFLHISISRFRIPGDGFRRLGLQIRIQRAEMTTMDIISRGRLAGIEVVSSIWCFLVWNQETVNEQDSWKRTYHKPEQVRTYMRALRFNLLKHIETHSSPENMCNEVLQAYQHRRQLIETGDNLSIYLNKWWQNLPHSHWKSRCFISRHLWVFDDSHRHWAM